MHTMFLVGVKSRILCLPLPNTPFSTFCTFKPFCGKIEYREVQLEPSRWSAFPATTMPSPTVWGPG